MLYDAAILSKSGKCVARQHGTSAVLHPIAQLLNCLPALSPCAETSVQNTSVDGPNLFLLIISATTPRVKSCLQALAERAIQPFGPCSTCHI
mmetsp:Transcript_22228/g.61973  ORF Transcript_22228/g.61973 Transcript_22228/m.61973 type:complete len:92 (+) Transcript_22228:1329-1604(+)